LEDLRYFLSDYSEITYAEIKYIEQKKGYILQHFDRQILQAPDILVLAKVLLESRAFSKIEMAQLLEKLLHIVDAKNQKRVRDFINNEYFHYVPVKHEVSLIDKIWDLHAAISERRVVEIEYLRLNDTKTVHQIIQPLGLMFSDYYFYVIAATNHVNLDELITFRLDRLTQYKILGERFFVSEKDRFEEGKFRKQVQFMRLGKLMKIKFKYWNKSLEAILDRLPNAKVKHDQGVAIIEAEVYGKGIMMWLLSQGPHVEVLSPSEFREEMAQVVQQMANLYDKSVEDDEVVR
jgi:predicted DNA-binding transcriptional regulator YafY